MRRAFPIVCLLTVSLWTASAYAMSIILLPTHDWRVSAGDWHFGLVEFGDFDKASYTIVYLGKYSFTTFRPAWQVAVLAAAVPVVAAIGYAAWPRRQPRDGEE